MNEKENPQVPPINEFDDSDYTSDDSGFEREAIGGQIFEIRGPIETDVKKRIRVEEDRNLGIKGIVITKLLKLTRRKK